MRHIPVPQGGILLALLTLGSYATGLLRDRVFAHTFGALRELDAYNAAFLAPDFLFNMFIASGIAAAFVPIFVGLSRQNRKQAEAYAQTVMTAAVITMATLGAVLALFAPQVSAVVVPGFTGHDRELVTQLMRIIALSPVLFAASNALGALLVAEQRFFFYGLSPLLYNLGIIGGTVLFAPSLGIMGAAIGTVVGAFLHLSVRLGDAYRSGFRYRRRLHVRTPEFTQTLRLMLPKIFGHPLELATFWVFTSIASGLTAGSIAVLNFSRNFQSVPVAIIGIAVSTAAFPLLARAAAEGSAQRFRAVLMPVFWAVCLLSAFAAGILYLIREPLVAILLGGEAFDADAVHRTAATLGVFTLAVIPETLSQLLSRAYYATKNTLLPVIFALFGFFVSVGCAWLLVPSFGLLALPLAFALGSGAKFLLLLVVLPTRIRRMQTKLS